MEVLTPPLVERDADLAALVDALEAARAGRGSAILVDGEAGIGKTALLSAACAAAGTMGLRVMRAAGVPLDETVAYGVARQLVLPWLLREADRDRLLRGAARLARPALLEDDGSTAPGEETPFAIREGLTWLVVGMAEAGGPLALVVDDLHWVDSASLRFLQTLAGRIAEQPVAVLLAARPGGAWADPGAAADLESALRVIRPARLSPRGVREALADRLQADPAPEFAAAAHAETAGSPYLVAALAEALRGEGIEPTAELVPAITRIGVAEIGPAVAARVRDLDDEARAIVRSVAVWGDRRPSDEIEQLAGVPPSASARAAPTLDAAGLLRGWPELAFDHPLVRSAVLDDLDAAERVRLHARAADLATAAGDVERAAAHLVEVPASGSREHAEVLHRVGRRAMHRGVPDVAVRLLRRALAEAPPDDVRGPLLLDLGLSEMALGDGLGPDRLAAAASTMSQPDARLRTLAASGLALSFLGRWDEAFDRVRAAVEESSDASAGALLVTRLELAAAMLSCVPSGRDASALIDRLEPEAPAEGPLRSLFEGVAGLRDVGAGMPRDGVMRRLGRAAAGPGVPPEFATTPLQGLPLIALVLADAFTEAEMALSAAVGGARRRLDVMATVRVLSAWLALNRVRRGRLTEAAEAVLAIDEGEGQPPAIAITVGAVVQASIALERGDLEAAARWADRPLEDDPLIAVTNFMDAHLALRARVRLAQGAPEEARRLLTGVGRSQTQWGGESPPGTQWRTYLALTEHALGNADAARELIDEELAAAERFGAPRPFAAALRARATIAGADERAAERDLRAAAAALEGSGAELERARVDVDLGELLLRDGRTQESLELLRPGLERAWECGADALAERARAALAQAGARPRRPELTGVRALTPAEARTARMAAEGMTNREIAEALFVTEKTVETHLTAAYRKLNVAGRPQLAAALGGPADQPGSS